jgi:hypothetical protein
MPERIRMARADAGGQLPALGGTVGQPIRGLITKVASAVAMDASGAARGGSVTPQRAVGAGYPVASLADSGYETGR